VYCVIISGHQRTLPSQVYCIPGISDHSDLVMPSWQLDRRVCLQPACLPAGLLACNSAESRSTHRCAVSPNAWYTGVAIAATPLGLSFSYNEAIWRQRATMPSITDGSPASSSYYSPPARHSARRDRTGLAGSPKSEYYQRMCSCTLPELSWLLLSTGIPLAPMARSNRLRYRTTLYTLHSFCLRLVT
jgi:hypothetical protein